MNRNYAVRCIVLCTQVLMGSPIEEVAFLKDSAIMVIQPDGEMVSQLAGDVRPKGMLRWLPDGQHLSYVVRDDHGAKARIVVVDLKGAVQKEASIRPVTVPPTEGLRFVEELSWISAHKLRVGGSVNPRNCETFVFDIETEKESNWQVGVCGSFVPSPDGNHIASLGVLPMSSDEERLDTVVIDNEDVVYGAGENRIRVESGPYWSENSQNIAFVERRVPSGEAAITVLSLKGRSDRVPVSAEFLRNPALTWIGSEVVLGRGSAAIVVDRANRRAARPSADVLDRLQKVQHAAEEAERETGEAQQLVSVLVLRLGGRDGVGWPEQGSRTGLK